jgi:ankyrin repeat protein
MALLLLQHQAVVDPLDQDGRTPLLLGLTFLRKMELIFVLFLLFF